MRTIKKHIYSSLQGIYDPEELKSLAIIICQDILDLPYPDIYLNKDTNLSADKHQLLDKTINRLLKFEPIQYIRGTAYFHSMTFRVAPGALIPRPETEEMVDLVVKENLQGVKCILDIGTGSGCIAITLDKKIPGSTVEGWDISPQALEVAKKNNINLRAGVCFRQIDILDFTPENEFFDIIVSNPPYITEQEKRSMHKNVLDWEPQSALFVPDTDPLLFYRRIVQLGLKMLTRNGKIYFEINQAYGQETRNLLHFHGYKSIRLIKDILGNNRIVTATAP